MTLPRHLVTVWNPSHAPGRHGGAPPGSSSTGPAEHKQADTKDDAYVWWGKIRSPNRKGALPHAEEIVALDEQVRAGTETHLYLTDYRSLYVAWVGEITAEHLPKEQPEELDHMPAYYRDQFADFWFQLWDIRRLVADDTPVGDRRAQAPSGHALSRSSRVSLYGGMVDLPLIVTGRTPSSWFAAPGRPHGRGSYGPRGNGSSRARRSGWAGAGTIFSGPRSGATLEPATRTFLASAEALFRARQGGPGVRFLGTGGGVRQGRGGGAERAPVPCPEEGPTPESRRRTAACSSTAACWTWALKLPPNRWGSLLVLLEKKPVIARGCGRRSPQPTPPGCWGSCPTASGGSSISEIPRPTTGLPRGTPSRPTAGRSWESAKRVSLRELRE